MAEDEFEESEVSDMEVESLSHFTHLTLLSGAGSGEENLVIHTNLTY